MTEASIPPQPTRSPGGTADLHGLNGLDGLDGLHELDGLHDLDDLVIEDLTGAPWEAVAPRICICTVSGE